MKQALKREIVDMNQCIFLISNQSSLDRNTRCFSLFRGGINPKAKGFPVMHGRNHGAPDRNRTCITPLGGESSVH